MFIINVAPFRKGIHNNTLSYFSNKKIPVGSIVTVPIRSKIVKGMVIDCENGINIKQELKDAKYQIKKVSGISESSLFNHSFIDACQKTADFFVSSPGGIINSLVPKEVLDNTEKFLINNLPKEKKEAKDISISFEKYIIQTSDAERYSNYKSLVRTQFAKGKSVIFCVPTIEDTRHAESLLSKGIEKNTFIFNSKVSGKKLTDSWNEAVEYVKPILIICTGGFLSIPRNDLGYVIVERENSKAYKTFSQPFFDIRKFAEFYAEASGAALLMGDLLLRAETLWRYDSHEFLEHGQIRFRFLNTAESSIVDMKNEPNVQRGNKSEYPVLSEQLKDILKRSQTSNEQTLLLTSRKGLFPTIVCGDCGEVLKCDDCSSPLVLYGKLNSGGSDHAEVATNNNMQTTDVVEGNENNSSSKNYFLCHHCNQKRSATAVCQKCGSWKLNMLGLGIENVAEKLSEIIPEENIFIVNKDRCSTQKQVHDVINEFRSNPSGILLGTEMVLLYLKDEVANVGIVSIDSMLSIPDFQIKERLLNILLRARERAANRFIVQTRHVGNQIFKEAVDGNLADFYRQEFIERKKFNYPPFSILIKISGSAPTKAKIKQDFEGLSNFLLPFKMNVYNGLTEKIKNQFIMHGLIKLPREDWINKELAQRLSQLPRQFRLEIDTNSVL